MLVGDIYKVSIESEDYNGNGITRINNIVVFVCGALKDEILNIKIDKINKHYANASIVDIIEKSSNRVDILCKYNSLCGGCNFLHTTYDNEINNKLNYLKELFNIDVEYLENKNIYNYRNKVVLHVLNGKLGFFNDKTHNLCEIEHCYLLNPKINLKINDLKKYNLLNVKEIMIRCISDEIMINITTINNNIDDLINIQCDSLYINDKYIHGKKYLIDEINNFKFSIYPNSFYQINREGMQNIYNKAYSYLSRNNKLLDLYCGTGTIGIWLNYKFNYIYGVEVNSSSIDNANINKKLNNLNNIDFKCCDASKIKDKFDTIVVDPPRSGLSNDVIKYLNNSNSHEIVYISCNPKTLKRDIDKLDNYELTKLSFANMFPRTKHIECVCILKLK